MNAGGDKALATQQRLVVRNGALAVIACALVLIAAVIATPLLPPVPVDPLARFAVALQADLFVVVWVLIAIRRVSSLRFRSAHDIAGSAYGSPSEKVAIASAFLQNTLEQAFIAVIAHLALASVGGAGALAYVLASVGLFALGRIAFWVGYPGGAAGRAFGIVMTMVPTIGAFAWAISLVIGNTIQALALGI